MRSVPISLFAVIGLTLVGSAHYYVWARLVRDPQLPDGAAVGLTLLLVLLGLSIPASFVTRRRRSLAPRWAVLVPLTWLGVIFECLVLLGATDLVRAAASATNALDLAQLDFWNLSASRDVATGVGGTVLLVTLVALIQGTREVAVRRVPVRLTRLPARLDGLRMVQLSDVHVGPTIGRAFVERVVTSVNALDADVIVITGDLVDGPVAALKHATEPLGELRARYGVYFVTGNHEYYSGVHSWCERLTDLGIRVLRNERVSIGDAEASFDLAGIDDASAHRFGRGHGADLDAALAGRDPGRELVLLAHQPRAVSRAEHHGVGLMLSGHTHGGQIWPWNFLVKLQQPFVSGLNRRGNTQVYVSRGTGYWGPPMRLLAPAEITELTLTRDPTARAS